MAIALAILASVFATDKLAAWWDPDISSITEEEYWLNREEASRYIHAIYLGFEPSVTGTSIYPDFFAGFTFDADGRLVLPIVESGLEQARNHVSIGRLLEAGVQYRLVEFSFAELLATQNRMWNVERHGCRYMSNVTHGFPCATRNRAVIGLYRYNDAMIAGFRRYVYDSPMIAFEQGSWISLNGQGSIWPMLAMVSSVFAIIAMFAILVKRR